MFKLSQAELEKLGASITTQEIKQQPELWEETFKIYDDQLEEIEAFLDKVKTAMSGKIRVLFTGAGTSQYVGDTVVPHLNKHGDRLRFSFESAGTTDIVASPESYLLPDEPTILVSYARSGNSPESIATVDLANRIVKNLYHITITCAADGALAKAAESDEDNLLLLMPPRSNDAGFAMTGSYTCMTLTGLLVFDSMSLEEKHTNVDELVKLGNELVEREVELEALVDRDYNRVVYLGSGSLFGVARESQLKVLELTAGEVATVYDTTLGFRHGPKSFINQQTIVLGFVSNHVYTRNYDLDLLEEVAADQIAAAVVAIGQPGERGFDSGDSFMYEASAERLEDGYLSLAAVIYAQTFAVLTSLKVNNKPDTPSKTGTVNRVVKGVQIHEYS